MAATAAAKNQVAERTLQGPEKAAALLLAMGQPLSGRLLAHFDTTEIKQVTRSIADLGSITAKQIEQLVEEFASKFSGGNLLGSASDVEKLLTGILPADEVSDIMSDVLGYANRSIWDRISGVSENIFANYLLKEHPQTAALILSKVRPAFAARTMGHLPPPTRHELMRRMLNLKPIVEDTAGIVEKTLHEDFMLNFARNMGADTHARMADILNKMERNDMEDALEGIQKVKPESAEMLKGLLFTFDDIINLTPRARQSIFDQIPTERVVLALKGTDMDFRDIILSSLATRARRIVEHELDSGEPISQRDVVEARRMITDLALDMAGRGEIELNSGQDDDTYVR
ncbi:flagellar motor switch protein FliG [Flaviflagellibacter deserti]|jgi:flagellar motor switch protein FliG|uniref:Flagellar motor switch protein FliG n=1 Tax=Flaviflagellibacter deserti TaxID=2267266 RepID=A0ABV9Z782_9HYPH